MASSVQAWMGTEMIPEAAGATPFGIFMLADAFLEAARDTASNRRKLTEGPTRLLCCHACGLFLKAYLRECGEDISTLRDYGHDLRRMLDSATAHGLTPTPQIVAQIKNASEKNDYVRVRYMVVEDRFDTPPDKVLKLAEGVRPEIVLQSH